MPTQKLIAKEQLERKFMDHLRDNFPETDAEAKIKLWMRDNEDLKQAETVCDFNAWMDKYGQFDNEDIMLVNEAYTQFLESLLAQSVLADSDS